MLKRLTGQELFILSAGILTLVFIYLVLIMTEHSTVTYENSDYKDTSIDNVIYNGSVDEKYYTYSSKIKELK